MSYFSFNCYNCEKMVDKRHCTFNNNLKKAIEAFAGPAQNDEHGLSFIHQSPSMAGPLAICSYLALQVD